jgi:hypothetical protein
VKNASNVEPPIALILIAEFVSLRILQLLNSFPSSFSVENGWALFHKRVNAFLPVVGRIE